MRLLILIYIIASTVPCYAQEKKSPEPKWEKQSLAEVVSKMSYEERERFVAQYNRQVEQDQYRAHQYNMEEAARQQREQNKRIIELQEQQLEESRQLRLDLEYQNTNPSDFSSGFVHLPQ